jgi:hypothetical protein
MIRNDSNERVGNDLLMWMSEFFSDSQFANRDAMIENQGQRLEQEVWDSRVCDI